MQVDALLKLLDILGPYRSPDKVISVKDIALKWDGRSVGDKPVPATVRTIQRYVSELSSRYEDLPALLGVKNIDISVKVKKADSKRSGKVMSKEVSHFYLPPENLVKWFMTEAVALQLMVTGQVVGQSLGAIKQLSTKDAEELANAVLSREKAAELRKVASCVRIVPDGIGRQRATVAPNIIQKIIDAIVMDRAVALEYTTPSGKDGKRIVNPLGLVSKDGTIYLVASKGFDPTIIHYALQRASDADVASRHIRHVPEGFDLDKHIDETHLLSHAKGCAIHLELEVHDDALYHFSERAFNATQIISKSKRQHWNKLTAVIPDSVLLVPFLVSMLEFVRVMGPASLRHAIQDHLNKMARLYE